MTINSDSGETTPTGPATPPSCSCVDLYRLVLDKLKALEEQVTTLTRRLDGGESPPPIPYNFQRREREVRASVLRQAGLAENIRYPRIIDEWIEVNVRARMAIITQAIESGRHDLRYLPRNVITTPASYQVTRAITEARLDFE